MTYSVNSRLQLTRKGPETWGLGEGLRPLHHKIQCILKCDTDGFFGKICAMDNEHEIWSWGSQWSLETGLL